MVYSLFIGIVTGSQTGFLGKNYMWITLKQWSCTSLIAPGKPSHLRRGATLCDMHSCQCTSVQLIYVTDGTKSQLSGCYVSLSALRTWDRTAYSRLALDLRNIVAYYVGRVMSQHISSYFTKDRSLIVEVISHVKHVSIYAIVSWQLNVLVVTNL